MPKELKGRYTEPVPLGKVRDLNKEESDRLLQLPFEALDQYPLLDSVAVAATDSYRCKRQEFGLHPQIATRESVRLISATFYDTDPFLQKYAENGACFHAMNRTSFVRFDRREYQDPVSRMRAVYAITHELGHAAMERGGLCSHVEDQRNASVFKLNEGITDSEAQRIINRNILPALYSDADLRGRNAYIEKVKPQIDGVLLEASDLILTARGRNLLTFSYIPEIRLVTLIQVRWPLLHRLLLRRAYRGEQELVVGDLEKALGIKACDQLLRAQGDTVRMIEILSKI